MLSIKGILAMADLLLKITFPLPHQIVKCIATRAFNVTNTVYSQNLFTTLLGTFFRDSGY